MREIFKYKSKNILYSTGIFEEDDDKEEKKGKKEEKAIINNSPVNSAPAPNNMAGLTPEEMAIVNASKSDNRISDNVADIVAQNL